MIRFLVKGHLFIGIIGIVCVLCIVIGMLLHLSTCCYVDIPRAIIVVAIATAIAVFMFLASGPLCALVRYDL